MLKFHCNFAGRVNVFKHLYNFFFHAYIFTIIFTKSKDNSLISVRKGMMEFLLSKINYVEN